MLRVHAGLGYEGYHLPHIKRVTMIYQKRNILQDAEIESFNAHDDSNQK